MNSTVKGPLAATGALAAVGSLVAASDVIAGYPVAGGQALRYALAGALLVALAHGRLPRPTAREFVLLSALAGTGLVLFNLCVVEAVRRGDPGTVGVIIGCVPVVLALAAPVLDHRRPDPRLVAAAAVVALGAAGVEQVGGGISALGLLLSLGALACEACFSLFAVPVLRRLNPVAVSSYSCLIAVPMLAALAFIADGPSLPAPTLTELAGLLYLGSIVTVCGFVLWYVAIGHLGAERAGLFSGVLPISALTCAALIGAAEITPARVAAITIVVLGIGVGLRVGQTIQSESPASRWIPIPAGSLLTAGRSRRKTTRTRGAK